LMECHETTQTHFPRTTWQKVERRHRIETDPRHTAPETGCTKRRQAHHSHDFPARQQEEQQ
ncbi:MAG: hypothetical protein ACK56I_07605, partial [bacterium]